MVVSHQPPAVLKAGADFHCSLRMLIDRSAAGGSNDWVTNGAGVQAGARFITESDAWQVARTGNANV